MRSILEVITFFTPIDTRDIVEKKESAIEDMVLTAMENSAEAFKKNISETQLYRVSSYSIENIRLDISIKKDEYMDDYYDPHLALEIFIEDGSFQKENIESFLNTVIRFFSGMYRDSYFIFFDSQYEILAMNQGKKYTIDDLKDINIHSIFSEKNKSLLDSLFYLHYTLERRIKESFSLDVSLSKIISKEGILIDALNLAKIRKDQVTQNLIQNLKMLHSQIEIVLQYFL
jgi:hypothetical protein